MLLSADSPVNYNAPLCWTKEVPPSEPKELVPEVNYERRFYNLREEVLPHVAIELLLAVQNVEYLILELLGFITYFKLV